MYGAIIGDIIGSGHEGSRPSNDAFPLFTNESHYSDDTVMTLAVSEAIMNMLPLDLSPEGSRRLQQELIKTMTEAYHRHPTAGYGMMFHAWCESKDKRPYGSYGNGSAMRVSFVGWISKTLKEAEELATLTAAITHDHEEGIKGARAIAASVFLAKRGCSKEKIKDHVVRHYYPRLKELSYAKLLKTYSFDATCAGSVPEAILCFLVSKDFSDCLHKVIRLGGDTDTIGAMAGAIAEAYYKKIPDDLIEGCLKRLSQDLKNILTRARSIIAERIDEGSDPSPAQGMGKT